MFEVFEFLDNLNKGSPTSGASANIAVDHQKAYVEHSLKLLQQEISAENEKHAQIAEMVKSALKKKNARIRRLELKIKRLQAAKNSEVLDD